MDKIGMVKTVGTLIVSIGVGTVVGNGIKFINPSKLVLINRVLTGVGALVLSNMVGDQAAKYVENKVDIAVEAITKNIEEQEELN